jgi:hypothetical protein
MSKILQYLKKLKQKRFGTSKAVYASGKAVDEHLIFPSERFFMPAINDVFGKPHSSFMKHEAAIPALYVRSFKNAFCFTDREEIYSAKKDVIFEYTTQKINPKIGESKKIFYRTKKTKINATVAHLCLSGLEANYYHFLTECLGRFYLLKQSKFKPDYYIIADQQPFQAEMLNLLGIPKEKIISTKPNQLLQVATLIVPDLINNWEYINYRDTQAYQKQWAPSWLVNLYREKLSLLTAQNVKGTKIYISRDKAQYRTFENKKEANPVFAELGFETYYLEEMNITRQIEVFANAAFIVGVHGAGLANLYFANTKAKVLEIFPEHYHDNSYRALSTAQGLSYSYIIGKTPVLENSNQIKEENLYIDAVTLKQALVNFLNS